jgi:hypothetical protein
MVLRLLPAASTAGLEFLPRLIRRGEAQRFHIHQVLKAHLLTRIGYS